MNHHLTIAFLFPISFLVFPCLAVLIVTAFALNDVTRLANYCALNTKIHTNKHAYNHTQLLITCTYSRQRAGFVVHRGRTIPTLASMQEPLVPARLRQAKEKTNTDSKADERGKQAESFNFYKILCYYWLLRFSVQSECSQKRL